MTLTVNQLLLVVAALIRTRWPSVIFTFVVVSPDSGPRRAERDGPSESGSDPRVRRQRRGRHRGPQPAKHGGRHAQLQRRETGEGWSETLRSVLLCCSLSAPYGPVNSQHALLQVMGSLTDKKCVQGQRVSGILIKRNFNYHIVTPSDLSSQ